MKDAGSEELFLYAVRILGARAYSEATLRRKLARKAQPEVVQTVLERIKRMGYLDDQKYAEGYARLHTGKWGPGKLRRALLEKGIARDLVESVLTEHQFQHDPVEEALDLLERFSSRHRGEKPRGIRLLVNRGYALEHALAAWERYQIQTA